MENKLMLLTWNYGSAAVSQYELRELQSREICSDTDRFELVCGGSKSLHDAIGTVDSILKYENFT